MIRDIVKDEKELSKVCRKFLNTKEDKEELEKIIKDLIDTGSHYRDDEKIGCVGLAANQIGYDRRVIIVNKKDGEWAVFVNPVIKVKSRSMHESEEGCLSLEGIRTVMRHDAIEILYRDQENFHIRSLTATGGTAVILQHEIDHLNGVLI